MTLEILVLRNALNLRCWCPDDPRRPQSWLPGQAVVRVLAQRMYHTQGPARGQPLCCAVVKTEASTVKMNLVPDHTASQGQGWPLNSVLLMTASCPQHPLEAGPRVPFHVWVLSSEDLPSVLQQFLSSAARSRRYLLPPVWPIRAVALEPVFGEHAVAAVLRLQGASRPAGSC